MWVLDGYDVAPAGYKPQEVADGGQPQEVARDTVGAPPPELVDGGALSTQTNASFFLCDAEEGYEPQQKQQGSGGTFEKMNPTSSTVADLPGASSWTWELD